MSERAIEAAEIDVVARLTQTISDYGHAYEFDKTPRTGLLETFRLLREARDEIERLRNAALAAAKRVAGLDDVKDMATWPEEIRAQHGLPPLSPCNADETEAMRQTFHTLRGALLCIAGSDSNWSKYAQGVIEETDRLVVSPGKDMDELCAACKEPRREHVTPGGTRYGPGSLCSVFIPASAQSTPDGSVQK